MTDYEATITCMGCGAKLKVEGRGRGTMTEAGLATFRAAGWQIVATEGLRCRECRERAEQRPTGE